MDSGFMFTYAGGSFITGQLGDRFSPVAVVAGGLLGSTICLLLIVFGASTSIIHNAAFCGTWFLTCQLLHGAFQATGGPVSFHIIIGLAFSLYVLSRSILPLWEIGSLQKEEGWFSVCGLAINTLEILLLLSSLVGFYTLVMTGDGASLSQLLLMEFGHLLTCGLFQTVQKRQGKCQIVSGFFFYVLLLELLQKIPRQMLLALLEKVRRSKLKLLDSLKLSNYLM